MFRLLRGVRREALLFHWGWRPGERVSMLPESQGEGAGEGADIGLLEKRLSSLAPGLGYRGGLLMGVFWYKAVPRVFVHLLRQ